MLKRLRVVAFGMIAGFCIVACGGGGGGGTTAPVVKASVAPSASSPPGSTGPQSAAVAPAAFKILIPTTTTSTSSLTTSSHRSKRSVATNTQSITFTLAETTATGATTGVASSPVPLTSGSPGCATVTNGLQCTISINAVIGTDIYTVATYSSTTAAAGTENGSGAFSIVVQANQANTASLTLNGAVASVVLTSAIPFDNGYQTLGLAGQTSISTSAPVYPIALDSSGNVILSPDTYSSPIILELVDNYSGDDSRARSPGAAGHLRRPTVVSAGPPPYGQITVQYASYDPVSGTATASATSGQYSVLVYSPSDIVTVSTTAADVYSEPYSTYFSEFIGINATLSSSPSSPAPVISSGNLPSNQLSIAIAPLVSPSPSPPPSTITFTGYAEATPEPTLSAVPSPPPGPQSGLLGFQTPYTFNSGSLASAALDLGQVPSGDYVFVYLTGAPMGSSPLTIVSSESSTGGACGNYFSGLRSLLVGSDYVVEFLNNVPTYAIEPACTITLEDVLTTTATLEIYANYGGVSVSGKSRTHK